jgi:SAM-dependent methyltransferase
MRAKPEWRDPDPSWPGADRRYPTVENPSYITLRLLREAIEDFAASLTPPGSILDLGCGVAPYAPLFGDGWHYVSVDREQKYPVRLVADFTQKLPFGDQSFDAILCTQVLEHVPDPELVAGEIHRLLKPGGVGFVSVPFAWEIHHYPDDYHRFTPESLQKLFREFAMCDVKPLEPSDFAWVQSKLIRWHRCKPDSSWRKFWIRRVNRWLWRRRDRFQDKFHPGNLVARIQK